MVLQGYSIGFQLLFTPIAEKGPKMNSCEQLSKGTGGDHLCWGGGHGGKRVYENFTFEKGESMIFFFEFHARPDPHPSKCQAPNFVFIQAKATQDVEESTLERK